jgi:hypothetical protein
LLRDGSGNHTVTFVDRRLLMFRLIKRLPWIAAGGVVVWFFDPRSGAERRHEARDRIAELTGGRAEPTEGARLSEHSRAEAAA